MHRGPSTRGTTDGRIHAETAPLRPRVRGGPVLGGAHGRPRAAPLGARGDPAGQGAHDGSIGIRCSCRAAICGSCGVRINGRPDLACHTHLDKAEKQSKDGVIEVEPMGNMPVIKDLIVDMEAVHWKKIRRVTPWLIAKQPVPEREYIVPRESMVDVTQSMACIQCGACVSDCLSMEVDPRVHRPGGARQGVPLRRRPARRPALRAPGGPRRGPARHLRLHPLLSVHRRVPEGRRADEPDHAPASPCRQRPQDLGPQQRRAPRARLRLARQAVRAAQRGRAAAALLRRRHAAGEVQAVGGRRAGELAARDRQGAAAPQGHARRHVQAAQARAHGPRGGQARSTTRSRAARSAASSTSTSPDATRISDR